MCSSAAWQRLERFLQTSSWKVVDDLGSMSPKKRNQVRKCSVRSACYLRASRKLLREEWSAVHEVLVEEEISRMPCFEAKITLQ